MNSDKTTIHIVVIFIGIIAASLCGGMLWLNSQSQHIDPVLSTAAGGALGALTALLASTRGSQEAAPVAVVNDTPIPVTESAPAKHAADDSAPIGENLAVNDLTT